jgi:hypothetical protein
LSVPFKDTQKNKPKKGKSEEEKENKEGRRKNEGDGFQLEIKKQTRNKQDRIRGRELIICYVM